MTLKTLLPLIGALLSAPAIGDPIALNAAQMKQLGVQTAAVEDVKHILSRRLPARVVIPPGRERVVGAAQAGMISELKVAEGDHVRAGQALAVIESPQFLGLQRDFLAAATRRRLIRAELGRDETLFKEGIIAERRLLETRARFDEQDSMLNERRQALRLTGLSDTAIQQLQRRRRLASTLTRVAPIDGVVLERQVSVGDRVEPAAGLYRIARLDPLWLAIRVPVEELRGIREGAGVSIEGCTAPARVSAIGSAVDARDQSVLVRARTEGPSACIRPGQFVEVRLNQGAADTDLHRVPPGAVVRAAGASLVFLQNPQGFDARPVTVISEGREGSVIRATLGPDERVATTGVSALKAAWQGMGGGE